MKKLDKRILDAQIEVFLNAGERYNFVSYRQSKTYLDLFAMHSTKTDIYDVDEADIASFETLVNQRYQHFIYRENALMAVRSMKRFYAARTKNAQTRWRRGRPPHISQIAKTQEYRKKGLKLKDIAVLMGKPLSLVHRWIKYPLNGGEE